MSWRYQLPVSSPVSLSTLARAVPYAFATADAPCRRLKEQLSDDLSADRVILAQSGTAALVLAIRRSVRAGGTLALPAYGCADLVSAAIRAKVRVRLYDIEPSTLSPDLESLERTVARQVDAVVVTHLFGVPADVASVQRLSEAQGAVVIEDAAQGLGSWLHGRAGGALSDLSVLSFGRGKGVSGGAGGALLLRGKAASDPAEIITDVLPITMSGIRPLLMSAAQLLIGHPSTYRVPASLPFLHLGEMLYKDAPEPAAMPAACAVLALDSLKTLPTRVDGQRAIAAAYAEVVPSPSAVNPVAGARPSWLRYPLLVDEHMATPAELGILRGYPAALNEQPHIASVLCEHEPDMPGARLLRRLLVTLPTHQLMADADVARVQRWIKSL